ncbi:MAG: sucrase ferredoxin [Jatrophihabitantaceae bacterium]
MADPLPAAAGAPERCSVLSAARGESMLGTAFVQPGVLLVEQPGPWGHPGLRASHFDAAVAAELETRADGAGLRLLAIRRPGRTPDGERRNWALSRGGVLRWSAFEREEELLDVALDGSVGTADPDPLYLVCAHSRRDVCCALRGRPLAAALEELRPGRVWECSHTGGHRFAPIVLALPLGALYGRVPAGAASEVVAASERCELLPELLRGVIGYQPVVQAAIGYALTSLGLASVRGFEVVDAVALDAGRWSVRLAVSGVGYEVLLVVDTVETPFASCGKPAAKRERRITPTALTRLQRVDR